MATQPIVRSVAVQNAQGNSENADVKRLWNYRSGAPGVTDDENDGFEAGDLWINSASDTMYVCSDATAGAAVWTAGGAPVGTVVKTEYTPQQTLLVSVLDQDPQPQVVGAGEFVGRAIAGNLGVITAAQARAIINASSEAEFDAIADAAVIDADRMVDDTFGTTEFAPGAGGKFAAGALDAAGAANLIADGVLLPRMNLVKSFTTLGAGNVAATAAQILGGILSVTANANTLTTPTAALLIANASLGSTIGASCEVTVVNGGAGTSTLTAADASVTITGDVAILTNTSATYQVVVTGAANVVFVRK